LLESAYQHAPGYELGLAGLNFKFEEPLAVEYKGNQLDCGYRLDLVMEDSLIIELKTVNALSDIHAAQLLTNLKLSEIKTGLLINFNVTRLVDGIKQVSN